jgi:hypothetical protein
MDLAPERDGTEYFVGNWGTQASGPLTCLTVGSCGSFVVRLRFVRRRSRLHTAGVTCSIHVSPTSTEGPLRSLIYEGFLFGSSSVSWR